MADTDREAELWREVRTLATSVIGFDDLADSPGVSDLNRTIYSAQAYV